MNEQWINGSNPLRALFISVGLYDAFIHPPIHSLSTYARQPPCLAGDVERDRHQNEFSVGSAFPAAALWLRQKLSEIYLTAHSNN